MVTFNPGSRTIVGIVRWLKGADLASAATLQIGSDGNYFDVTGTTTITALSSEPAGTIISLQFDGALTLTYNATSLILQGSVDLTTAAGDLLVFVSEGNGNWREASRRLAAALPTSFATPALVLGTANAAGSGTTTIRANATIVAFDTTVPVTQAFSDAAAAGTAAVAARRDHRHGMPAASAGAVSREGGQTTEATTTSTSAVSLLTAASLDIAANEPFSFFAPCRKASADGGDTYCGYQVNTTVISEAENTGVYLGGTAASLGDGGGTIFVGPRVTNYHCMSEGVRYSGTTATGAVRNQATAAAMGTNPIPIATITDLIIRAQSVSPSTSAADELQVYSWAAS